ncbi:hypothetical protein B0A52_04625 [Exophiala mesophila]|uniref:SAM-dependent MTase RsmB/NOP-type domain-containing protein n=1 Tax=Exophiala mesophila TaxID=212818 RepID=A0A438N8D2_EXOME|nr:hypothetical protein B0A52_04625 [Exophiala mesophila]
MALYYDAATVLGTDLQVGSLKSRVYDGSLSLQSKPAHLYALISETAKYDTFLSEVINNAGILALEPKLTPILCLLLTHDHLFSKGGIAASSTHHLRQAIERHKARLQAELTKARLRRKCATIEELKTLLASQKPPAFRSQPRWVRINTLKSSLDHEFSTTFKDYRTDASIAEVIASPSSAKVLTIDPNIPNLLAIPPDTNLTATHAYVEGAIILQDKASCFPAYLLSGEHDEQQEMGHCIDGCAAPGNKTSHLAAICLENGRDDIKVFACERDGRRSRILQDMMKKSGAERVTVLAKQDFLALSPNDSRFSDVTHLLLDPSCSGSGIVGREDIPSLTLPTAGKVEKAGVSQLASPTSKPKKRKRGNFQEDKPVVPAETKDAAPVEEVRDTSHDPVRLQKLSSLQTRIVEHALSFPNAVRVTYSTCSVHIEENELVVARILSSANAKGWRLLRREEQADGLRSWKHRGVELTSQVAIEDPKSLELWSRLSEADREACIRCHPEGEEGTMGFFVCCFIREEEVAPTLDAPDTESASISIHDEDSWEGFDE